MQEAKSQDVQLKSYVKSLWTLNASDLDEVMTDNFLHNRINLKVKFPHNFMFVAEARNRFFYGEQYMPIKDFVAGLNDANDYFELSHAPIKEEKATLHVMLDRLYLDWSYNDFELRVGRQRINLGKNLFWNPNDIFNAYSFYDFDYEERPGTDALLLRYYMGFASSVELIGKIADNFDDAAFAGVLKVNNAGYDYQFIWGKVQTDVIAGLGWAGNIKAASFKGEITGHFPYAGGMDEPVLSAGVGSSYSFSDKFTLNVEALFNSSGKKELTLDDFAEYTSGSITSRNLSPTMFSFAVQPSYNINPKNSAGLSVVWYAGVEAFYLSPVWSTQINNSLDFSLIGQMIFSNISGNAFEVNTATLSARLKWSF